MNFRITVVSCSLQIALCACHPSPPATTTTARATPPPPSSASATAGEALASKSPAELIELYVFHPDCGFRTFADHSTYSAALAHNKAITAELERRGDAATATCERHLGDMRNIFTGDGGPQTNVAGICSQLLANVGKPHPSSVRVEFCGAGH